MPPSTSERLPRLIVVTGRPGAGKTTLAHVLAREVRCPAICRDEFKEGLVTTLGEPALPAEEANPRVNETFFATLRLLLEHRVTVVAEAAFQHRVWAPRLESLREVSDLRIVLCTVLPDLAVRRRIERVEADPRRDRFHGDLRALAAPADYDPPHLDVPTLTVDTSDGYHPTLPEIATFASPL
jgi:predicted kinase